MNHNLPSPLPFDEDFLSCISNSASEDYIVLNSPLALVDNQMQCNFGPEYIRDINYNPHAPPLLDNDYLLSSITNLAPEDCIIVHPQSTPLVSIENQMECNFGPEYVAAAQQTAYLEMVEQPMEKFRFRYKSEMAGTHGSLSGKNSDKIRKPTYPTVELKNFNEPAIVRCSLYQYHPSSEEQQPHPHRLIRKVGNEEIDDPHNLPVGGAHSYQAKFNSMGIIHTARKNLVDELSRKKMFLKEEGLGRKLKKSEEVSIKQEAEQESKSIDMNIVCLRFDAFAEKDNSLYPICEPIYSHPINNLKSALTGELKIVRMDHNTSPAKGQLEIFMLVEKVPKNKIKVRFYEMDDDVEIWSDYGYFTELDVHHQYAIVFRTPPYRDLEITEHRKVFVELIRTTDGCRSEPREFMYSPSQNYQLGMKRRRMSCSYSTSGSVANSNERTMAFPLTVTERNIPPLGSMEFDELCKEVCPQLMLDPHLLSINPEDYTLDGPDDKINKQIIRSMGTKLSNAEVIKRVQEEFKSFLATKPTQEMVGSMLIDLFERYTTEDRENTLHLLVKLGNCDELVFWLEAIKIYKRPQILNLPNKDGHTVGHLAVLHGNLGIVDLICRYNPDFSLVNGDGNTPLHVAIQNSSLVIVDLLLKSGKVTRLPTNAKNNDSLTALHLAIAKRDLSCVKVLCEHGADVNVIDKKSGYNALHLSIAEQTVDITKYLVHETNINLLWRSYQEITPYQMAERLLDDGNNCTITAIFNIIENAMHKQGLDTEVYVKEEHEAEQETERDSAGIKVEGCTSEALKDMYNNISCFTSECLQEISEMLDESGKWEALAQKLNIDHIIYTDMFKKAGSKSKQILQCAEMECDIYEIRDSMVTLGELNIVTAMDKMIISSGAPL